MDRQKLIEDTIEVKTTNKDGQVFDRGTYANMASSSFYHILFRSFSVSHRRQFTG